MFQHPHCILSLQQGPMYAECISNVPKGTVPDESSKRVSLSPFQCLPAVLFVLPSIVKVFRRWWPTTFSYFKVQLLCGFVKREREMSIMLRLLSKPRRRPGHTQHYFIVTGKSSFSRRHSFDYHPVPIGEQSLDLWTFM